MVPSLTRRALRLRRCFPIFHLTHFLPSIQQGPRQHILWLSQRRWLFGPSSSKRHWLAPTRSIDHCCESALAVPPFQPSVLRDRRCVPVHRVSSWVSREKANDPSPQSSCCWRYRYHFGQACHPTSACYPITAVPSHVHSCFRLETLFIIVTNGWPFSE